MNSILPDTPSTRPSRKRPRPAKDSKPKALRAGVPWTSQTPSAFPAGHQIDAHAGQAEEVGSMQNLKQGLALPSSAMFHSPTPKLLRRAAAVNMPLCGSDTN